VSGIILFIGSDVCSEVMAVTTDEFIGGSARFANVGLGTIVGVGTTI
jgi:hypothetical protein